MHMGTTGGRLFWPEHRGSPPCTWGQRRGPAGCRFHAGSPHAHGDNAVRRRPRRARLRFTPMHMGTTVRLRVEQDEPLCGSPPCTWGQPDPPVTAWPAQRFTPMHMGTTGDCSARPGSLPRFTPMHMGTTTLLPLPPAGARFTPMHMGTTASTDRRGRWSQAVHPHAHGDNVRRNSRFRSLRFTPMHMGTTPCSPPPPSARTVHPHAHGDNALQKFLAGKQGGSPPCTWGQRRPAKPAVPELGSPPCTWGQPIRR